jgi:hypothetical protein
MAIDGLLTVEQPHCDHRRPKVHSASGTKELTKGSHDITILYANYGPATGKEASLKVTYKGPDTKNSFADIPQEKLGSAPLRIAKLAGELSKSKGNKTGSVIQGAFTWDESANVATMGQGSCNLMCRRGKMKAAGAHFKFFCEKPVQVSFQAMVNSDAKYAFIWLDSNPSYNWDMQKKSLLEIDGDDLTEAPAIAETVVPEPTSLMEAVYESMDVRDADAERGLRMSAPSKAFGVSAGEHTVVFQGGPVDQETFSFSQMSFVEGASDCKFFLDGKDKSAQECNR